jgi:hypothetical protein
LTLPRSRGGISDLRMERQILPPHGSGLGRDARSVANDTLLIL